MSRNIHSTLFSFIVYLLIYSILVIEVNTKETEDLIMVFILCRHGDRSPVHTFPTDPFRKLWKMGYGQLTAYGAKQHHELGQMIRKMYASLIPEVYHKDEVLFRSSGTERTLMSANNFIRGLYQLEKESTNHLPPVFSRMRLFNNLMNSSAVFKKAKSLQDFFSYLERMTGYTFPKDRSSPENFYPAWRLCDPITIWVEQGLPSIPKWVTKDVYQKCSSLLDFKHYIRFSEPHLTRLRGGPLAGHLVDLFRERIDKEIKTKDQNNPPDENHQSSEGLHRRFVAYFAHDSTLAALMSHLGVYNGLKPPLASCLIIELRRPRSTVDDFHLIFYYFNETRLPFNNNNTVKLINLWPPYCGAFNTASSCPFTKFESSIHGTYATDISMECYEDVMNTDQMKPATTTTRLLTKPTGMRIFESYCYYPQLLTLVLFQTAVVCYLIVRFLPIPMMYVVNSLRYLRL
ncbi:unnamed protein product [Trichobilharzia szidati]|nr:unnamed protein product [Trichobilharzia szidati]